MSGCAPFLAFFVLSALLTCNLSFFTNKVVGRSSMIKKNGRTHAFQRGQLWGTKYIDHVTKVDEKKRIDVYLSNLSMGRSRSYFNNLCERGMVRVNNKVVTKSYKVCDGDVIEFEVEEKTISSVKAENIPLDILFEDEHIIAINKPQGMVVHPAPGSPNATFVNALLHHLGSDAQPLLDSVELATKNDNDEILEEDEGIIDLPETPEAAAAAAKSLRPGVVHRLDKGTSGVLIAGKHPEAVSRLSQLFAERRIRKVYMTICVGNPGEATICEPIGRNPKNRQLMTAVKDLDKGRYALSHVRTICFDGKLSAALVRIETGRTHQIRVHLKERRTPIVGDTAYGNADWNRKLSKTGEVDRPLLHAYETEFTHPFTQEQVLLRAPVPSDMFSMLKKLEAPGVTRNDVQVLDKEKRLLLDHVSTVFPCDTSGYNAHAKQGIQGAGFVPQDRVAFDELHWTEQLLPEVNWKDVEDHTTRK